MSIFKAYDIRGVVPDELDADLARRIGHETARHVVPDGDGALVVGEDARVHSPELSAALRDGIRRAGVDVVHIGQVTTPMLYHAVEALAARGGVMVTASHNPGRYNGFKICREHAIPVGESSGLAAIAQAVQAGGPLPGGEPAGSERAEDVLPGYVEHVLGVARELPRQRLRAAIDCGNGMAGIPLEALLPRLRLDAQRLYFEPDGRFPNHEADPLKTENLREVCEAVRAGGAHFGVAFDGDGDRAVFVDDRGEPISSDLMTALIAREQLARHPGGLVLYDLRSSRVVPEEITRAGGVAKMCRVGHSFVKAQMREEGAIFAGELSGHFYFRFSETFYADDAVAAFVAALEIIGHAGCPLSELVAPLRRYHASGEINRRVADPAAVLRRVEAAHRDAPALSHLDGLYVAYEDWWFNLRPSNTEPVLRLNLEANTRERMIEERDRLLEMVDGEPA